MAGKPGDSRSSLRARQTKCAAEWKEAKAAGKVEKGVKWPKYWSACNKRLKGATRRNWTDDTHARPHSKTEGVGETESLADALCHHSNRGVSGNRVALVTP